MQTEKKDKLYILLIILAAILIRAVYIPFNSVIEIDGVEYATLAQNLLAGKGYIGLYHSTELLFPPLFPILIAAVAFITKDVELSARIISSLLGALTIIPVYLLAKEIYNKSVAFIAAIVLAFYPFMILASASTFSESPYTFFLTFGLYLFYKMLKTQEKKYAVLSGVMMAFAYLIKSESVYVFILFAAVIVTINVIMKKIRLKKIPPAPLFQRGDFERGDHFIKPILLSAIMFVSFFAVSSPYLIFLRNHAGRFLLEGKSSVNYIISERMAAGMGVREACYSLDEDGNPQGIIPDHNAYVTTKYGYGSINIPRLIKTMIVNIKPIYKKFPLVVITPLVIALIFYGLFKTKWDEKRLYDEIFLAAFAAILMLLIFLHTMIERYFVPIVPILIIWTALGIHELYNWFTEHQSGFFTKNAVRKGFLVLVITATLASNLVVFMTGTVYDEGKVKEARIAAKWLNERGKIPRKVMAVHSQVAYYSDSFFFLMPYSDGDRILKYAAKQGIDYIVVDERYKDDVPQIASWYTDDVNPTGLYLVFKDTSIKGAGIKIYEVVKD